ncbi:unnamed protein product, partial [Meganyctiphanes norvegica]
MATVAVLRNVLAYGVRAAPRQLYRTAPLTQLRPRFLSTQSTLLSERKYTDKHEWVAMDGGIGTIGITNYAQEALGDIVYAQLPEVGAEFEQMETEGALDAISEAVKKQKSYSDELLNHTLSRLKKIDEEYWRNNPNIVNSKEYRGIHNGYLFKMELTQLGELDDLMDEAAYDKYLKEQEE